ncbi:MAG: NAD-binding protein [Desulfohalobiaceae bacterium]
MKFLTSQLLYFVRDHTAKRNVRVLLKFLLVLVLLILLYSFLFHQIMQLEGREYSWPASIYWTLTVMTTLGFGDITFTTDLGRIFSVLVLLSGVVFLLVMLPFTFIQFFYAPWLEAQENARTPRFLPPSTQGHVILTPFDSVAVALIAKLRQYNYPYAVLVNEQQRALELFDQGYRVVLGDIDDRRTYERLRADRAALVFFNRDDQLNTNAIYTLRDVSDSTSIVANAQRHASMDIMELAGADQIFHFSHMLGRSLARRVLGMAIGAHIIGAFDRLSIAEVPALNTTLEGKTLQDSGIRDRTGVNVAGIWQRGTFILPEPETELGPHSVLVLAGTEDRLQRFDGEFLITGGKRWHPVLILGGGRVGQAAAKHLRENGIDYRIVEKNERLVRNREDAVAGDAAELDILRQAGIDSAPSVIVTTNDDNMNIYLTIYCRSLRPDLQIITRATLDRNVSQLHQAGANLVMSYATLGASAVINYLQDVQEVLVAEGLNIFRMPVPATLVGKSLRKSGIREKTGCNILAAGSGEDMRVSPGPDTILRKGEEIVLIGTANAEKDFLKAFEPNNIKHSPTLRKRKRPRSA